MEISEPLLKFIPKTKENRYFYENGLSHLIPRLKVKVHSRLEDCFELWEKFSPQNSVFDLWDFRLAWYQGYQYEPFFYTLYEGSVPLAVLPLWFDEEKKKYEWFGSYYMEDNTFFVKDEKFIDLLYKICPKPVNINAIDLSSLGGNHKFFGKLKPDDPKNIKNLKKFNNFDQLLHSLSKKNRHNLRSDYQKIIDLDPKITISDDKALFEKLVEMNIARFNDQPDEDKSDFLEPKRKQAFASIVKNTGKYKVKFIQVTVQDHLAAIDLIITYKDIYYSARGGNDVSRFKGIGNFMVYIEFEDAIKNNFSTVDCLQVDYNWKHRFFDQKPLFQWEA